MIFFPRLRSITDSTRTARKNIQYVYSGNIWYSINVFCGFFVVVVANAVALRLPRLNTTHEMSSFFYCCLALLLQQRCKFIAERQDGWKIHMIDDDILFSPKISRFIRFFPLYYTMQRSVPWFILYNFICLRWNNQIEMLGINFRNFE